MRSASNWPSRKTVIWVVIVLAAGSLLQVFLPPLNDQAKARQLYTDAWFATSPWDSSGRDGAISKFEQALRLDPGNSLYQQALVWHCNTNRLPTLLAHGHLDNKSALLARWRIVKEQVDRWKNQQPSSTPPRSPAYDPSTKQLLSKLDDLAQADPSNALALYEKAFVLSRASRHDEAFVQLEKALDIGNLRFFIPEVEDSIYAIRSLILPTLPRRST